METLNNMFSIKTTSTLTFLKDHEQVQAWEVLEQT